VIDRLSAYECTVQKKMLVVGDYLASDRVVIERKTTDDFVSSLIDKRLWAQMKAMKENFEKPLLIIEGETLYGRLPPNAIRGALAAIALDIGIPMIFTKNEEETAGLIYWIARREQLEEQREVSMRDKPRAETMAKKQEFIVTGLPNVSIVLSKRLLKHFKTILNIFNAPAEQLQEVEGIGKEKAKKIREVVEAEYK
jgi:Fanconi anemia group M protein